MVVGTLPKKRAVCINYGINPFCGLPETPSGAFALLRRVRNHGGSSAFGACLRARIGSLLPALVALAATPRDDVGQIIAAVIVGKLGTCSDALDGAYDDPVAYRVGLGIGPARVVCVASEVLAARSVNRPTAVDLVKIAAASGFKFIGLLTR
jgi:hypothetical protein